MFHRQATQDWDDYDDDGWADAIRGNNNLDEPNNSSENSDDSNADDDAVDNRLAAPPASFRNQLNQVLSSQFSDGCFVKLNWSSPRVIVL
jgi:hypothetical protein